VHRGTMHPTAVIAVRMWNALDESAFQGSTMSEIGDAMRRVQKEAANPAHLDCDRPSHPGSEAEPWSWYQLVPVSAPKCAALA
jgi:hypothetical protein